MANPKLEVRLLPILHAYLEDLAEIGYGKGKGGVARRFIENAVTHALENDVIPKRKVSDFAAKKSDD